MLAVVVEVETVFGSVWADVSFEAPRFEFQSQRARGRGEKSVQLYSCSSASHSSST